jgi:hypothetical protein
MRVSARSCSTLINERKRNMRVQALSLSCSVFRAIRPVAGLTPCFTDGERGPRRQRLRCDGPERQGRGDSPLSACRRRRSRANKDVPCRLRVHLARFPGLWVPLSYHRVVRAVPCLHLSRAVANARVR